MHQVLIAVQEVANAVGPQQLLMIALLGLSMICLALVLMVIDSFGPALQQRFVASCEEFHVSLTQKIARFTEADPFMMRLERLA
jgi:hypothetical protein